MPLSDFASLAGVASVIAILASLAFLMAQRRQMTEQALDGRNDGGRPGWVAKYPSAPLFQDHLEVIIRVNDWISAGNHGADVPPRDVFMKMPSRTIDTLVDQLGYFGYSAAIRKLYLKNETRINRVLAHPS